jgi:uncharacterized protein (DUF433 family)/DNA-binding transcriptional MerR regulator
MRQLLVTPKIDAVGNPPNGNLIGMITTRVLELGTGIYTFPEAARILRSVGTDVSPGQLRYWIAKGLAEPIPVAEEDFAVLSFDDLVSLEIVRRFRGVGASLQRIRRFNETLHERFPNLEHPFTYRIFFTDGAALWAQVDDDPASVIELVGRRPGQFAWRDAIGTFAKAIRWSDDAPARASGWRLNQWVEIDPQIQFGAPVVRGTRVTVRTISANLREGTPEEVAEWYGLDVDSVLGVRDYLALA